MTSQKDKDALLRAQDTYVDPLRARAKASRRKRTRRKTVPRKTITHLTQEGKPSAPTTSIAEAEPYPKHMKMGIMLMAVQDGVVETSKALNVPQGTIYGWFKQEGGLNAIREYTQAAATNSFTKLIQATCDELHSRMQNAPDDELYETFRKMLDAAEKVGISGVSSPGAKAGVSGVHPGSTQAPPINLIFNNPTPLPPGSEAQGNVAPSTPPEDVVEGEVTDVFDE